MYANESSHANKRWEGLPPKRLFRETPGFLLGTGIGREGMDGWVGGLTGGWTDK